MPPIIGERAPLEISQSGGIGLERLEMFRADEQILSKWVSMGNPAIYREIPCYRDTCPKAVDLKQELTLPRIFSPGKVSV